MTSIACDLRLGDCLDLMKNLPDASVDLVLCDLPYGTTACKWDAVIPFDLLWAEYKRVTKPGSAIVLTAGQPFTTALIASNLKNFKHAWVWNKRFAANFAVAKHQPLKIHEDIAVFSYGTARYFPQKTMRDTPIKLGKNAAKSGGSNIAHAKSEYDGKVYVDKNPESILFFDTRAEGQVKLHPTQKPVALMEYLIRTYTKDGDTVLDNCMGSGTTGVACAITGRRFIGMERDPDYFKIASDRILAEISAPDPGPQADLFAAS
jgi:site-specific DNA-methyltransferase (adenine-specific)